MKKKTSGGFRFTKKRVAAALLASLIVIVVIFFWPLIYLTSLDMITPYSVDNSILTDANCRPPCWHGLVIGESRMVDVDAFLGESNRIPDWAIHRSQGSYGYGIGWSRPLHGEMGGFSFDSQQVLKQLYLYLPESILIQDIIAVYGEPLLTRVFIEYPIDTPTHRRGLIGAELFYPAYGMIIFSRFDYEHEYGEENFRVPQNPAATRIEFFPSADDLNEFMRYVYPNSDIDTADDILQYDRYVWGWIGYGVTVVPSQTDYSIRIEAAD